MSLMDPGSQIIWELGDEEEESAEQQYYRLVKLVDNDIEIEQNPEPIRLQIEVSDEK